MKKDDKLTNWDKYYENPPKAIVLFSLLTRKIAERLILKLIKEYTSGKNDLSIIELGGANSSFYDGIKEKVSPVKYDILDNNELGLSLFNQRRRDKNDIAINSDILNLNLDKTYDFVFSVGFIKHFSVEDTAKVIKAHFDCANDDGIVLMAFPIPTFLYKIGRYFTELINIWIFHDERPLKMMEVLNEGKKYGKLLYRKLNLYVALTRGIVVFKKK